MIRYGFVKLPREVTDRPWFGDSGALAVYVFLLCNAAFEDFEYAGLTLRKGQYIASHRQLAEKTHLGIQQVKTALKNLTATRDITVEATTKFSIITVKTVAEDDTGNPRYNPQVNPRVNPQANPISRSKENNYIENNNVEVGAASPRPYSPADEASSFCSDKGDDANDPREALIGKYGSGIVTAYEQKFRDWAAKKNARNVPMYPTVAKWLAQDIFTGAGANVNSNVNSIADTAAGGFENSSLDVDEFEQTVMEQYKRGAVGKYTQNGS